MKPHPPRSTRTDTLLPHNALFRSRYHRSEKEAKGGKEHASCHRYAERIVTEREHQVLADVAHGGARQHDRLEHTGQFAANQSDTGAFDRHVGAGSHRNAYMRSRPCWRVVDADRMSTRLNSSH